MYKLNASPLLLSLMSSVASLPFFLFILPAGALADIVDRRKLLWVMNLWLVVAAGSLAGLAALGLLNPYLVLLCVFLRWGRFRIHRSRPGRQFVAGSCFRRRTPSATTLGGIAA